MAKTLKQIRAGRMVYAVVYTTPTAGDSPRARAQKRKASSDARERLNARTSFQKLERTLAANFDDGDLFISLTYDEDHLPPNRDTAMRRLRSFIPKLRATRKKRKQGMRYIYVTEGCYPGGRLHHHMVLDSTGEDLEEIKQLWIYGDVEIRQLKFDAEYPYEELASYLTKEPREWGHPNVGERTWTPSLGLEKPEPETDSVPDYLTLTAPPEAVILDFQPATRNGWGEYSWIKYMLPRMKRHKRPKVKRKKTRQKE